MLTASRCPWKVRLFIMWEAIISINCLEFKSACNFIDDIFIGNRIIAWTYTHTHRYDIIGSDLLRVDPLKHYMMTSSNGHFSRYWPFVREFTGEFPTQRPVRRSFDVFLDLRLNRRFSKQSWGSWFKSHGNVWTNVGPLRTNFSEILIEINTFSFKKMH